MATLTYEKFTIFGSGFDSTRNDSGVGMTEDIFRIGTVDFGAIDETGEYVWLTDGYNYLYKYKIEGMERQTHSVPIGSLYHPANVANNYGVIIPPSGDRVIVFNLTDGTIIKTLSSSTYITDGVGETILVDDVIYYTRIVGGRGTVLIYRFDLTNETVTTASFGNVACNGFVDENTLFMYYTPEWFHQTAVAYGVGTNGSTQWSLTASQSGGSGFNGVSITGALCGNGKIWIPTKKGDSWVMGMYNGNSTPNLNTPRPIKTFGRFESAPALEWQYRMFNYCYTQGKTKACFATTIGTYWTDFEHLEKLGNTPSALRPVAMNDHYIFSRSGNSDISIITM